MLILNLITYGIGIAATAAAARVLDEDIRTGAVDLADSEATILGVSWAWSTCYLTTAAAILTVLNVVFFSIVDRLGATGFLIGNVAGLFTFGDVGVNFLFCAMQADLIGRSKRRETLFRNMGRKLAARLTRDEEEQRLAASSASFCVSHRSSRDPRPTRRRPLSSF